MFSLQCNIDKSDRINRSIIGLLICLAVLFGMGRHFFFILGLVLLVEGLIGWCSIPYILNTVKGLFRK